MSDDLQLTLSIDDIMSPATSLRPLRKKSIEYLELVESVRKDGVLQPILVRPKGGKYEVVEGWHRLAACKEAGVDRVPCLVREMTDKEVLLFQVKCNAIRPKTASYEYARRLKLLMKEGLTIQELSKLIDKSPKWIADQLQLNRLAPEVAPAVDNGEMSMASALALANLPRDLQPKFVGDAVSMPTKEFTVRAKAALRDFKAFLLKEKEDRREQGAFNPKLRPTADLRREALESNNAKRILKASGARTMLQAWDACMAWIFQLDPISIERRKRGEKLKAEIINNDEFRKLNREIIKKFVKPQSRTGDYRK